MNKVECDKIYVTQSSIDKNMLGAFAKYNIKKVLLKDLIHHLMV